MVKGGTKAEEKQNGVSWARYLGLKNEPEPRWGFIRNRLIIQRIISLSPSTILLENFRLLVLQLVNLYLVVVTFSCLWQRLLEINIWIFLGWAIPIIAKIGKFHIYMNRDSLGVSLFRLFTSFLLFFSVISYCMQVEADWDEIPIGTERLSQWNFRIIWKWICFNVFRRGSLG